MTRSAQIIGLLFTMVGSAPRTSAQGLPQQVRFTTADSSGDRRWQGRLERLTFDSLQLRVGGADTIAAFSRSAVHSVARQHRALTPARAAGAGCLTGGVVLSALGFFGTHDPDSPGLEKLAGVLGLVVGCGAGAGVGFVVSLARGERWEAWVLPDSEPSSRVPPDVR
ncbi:hypothetical protein BH11GEM1_BH11GEM1_21280 [soil metagenome]